MDLQVLREIAAWDERGNEIVYEGGRRLATGIEAVDRPVASGSRVRLVETGGDFIAIAESVAGTDLSRLFDAWLFSETIPDFPTDTG